MKMITIIVHDLHPTLAPYLSTVKTANPAEVSESAIILKINDLEAVPADIRAFGRRIEEIRRVIDMVGHHELAKFMLKRKYFSVENGYQPRRESLVERLNQAAGRELSPKEADKILNMLTVKLKIRRLEGQKNSFSSLLQLMREAVSKSISNTLSL